VVEPILADELVVIVPAHHRWANRGSITPAEFCAEPVVLSEEGSSTRRVALERLGLLGLAPRIALELGHTEAVKRAAEAGLGISIISKHAVKTEMDTGRLKAVRLKGVDLHRHINLIYHRDKTPSDLTSAFLSLLQEKWHCQLRLINRG
jgi:DNA-binding transcriptional LysR family regulator